MLAGRGFFSILLGLAGAGLLVVNVYGYGRTLYHPQDHVYASRVWDNELTFTQTLAVIDAIDRHAGSETERATKLLDAVHRRMVEYDGAALRVSLADNWLIWGLAFLSPSFAQYEFIDPRRALRRGLGLCGQQALALVGLLDQLGFTAGRLRLRGHMTAWVHADDKEIILDPDFGAMLPFDIEHAEANLDEVRRLYYQTSAQRFSDPGVKARSLDTILATYAADNKRSGPGLAASAGGGALVIEHALYALKWMIPLLLLAAGGWLARRARMPEAPDRDSAFRPAAR